MVKGLLVLWIALGASACVVVPQNRRSRLADPMLQGMNDGLDDHRKRKLYDSREAAAGGNGKRAGGGCGCQ